MFRLLRKTLLLLCAFFFFIIIIIKVFRLSCGRPYHHCSRSLSSLILGFSVFNGRPYCYSLSIFGRFLVDFCPRDFSGMAERIILKILDLTSYHVESIPIEWFWWRPFRLWERAISCVLECHVVHTNLIFSDLENECLWMCMHQSPYFNLERLLMSLKFKYSEACNFPTLFHSYLFTRYSFVKTYRRKVVQFFKIFDFTP